MYCTITVGSDAASQQKKEKKKRKKEGTNTTAEESTKETILKKCNALLNSGGGVLEMEIANFQYSCTSTCKKDPVDSFWSSIEPQLKAMIKPAKYDDVFDRCVQSGKIFLFINAPQHFCTKKYNLFLSGDAGIEEACYQDIVDLLKLESQGLRRKANSSVAVPLEDLPEIPDTFTYHEVINLMESKQIQFKNYTSDTVLFTNHGQRDVISKQLSAFGNSGGGVILLGVGDDRKVCGLDMEKNSKEDVEENVTSLVNRVCCNFIPKRGIHWNVEFFPVAGPQSSAVIVIKMAGIQNSGGVFGKCPESYELRCNEEGQQVIHSLEFEEWKMRMKSNDVDLQGNSKGVYLYKIHCYFG